jgi:putative aldouronate transport system permease protein
MGRRQKTARTFKRDIVLYALLVVPVVFVFLFRYLPILGLYIGFTDYDVVGGLFASKWVGLMWFRMLVTSANFGVLLANTLILSFYSVLFEFPAPVILALSLNEIPSARFKRVAQTVSYLPYFISTVVVVGMMSEMLSPAYGVVNALLTRAGINPVFFMGEPQWFRPLFVMSDIWQRMGWQAIIYLAAITAISPDLYEAAQMDGASRMRRIWHITLPGILPTIVILLLMKLGHFMDVGFEKVLLMYSPATYETADIFDTFVYRRGIGNMDFSFATAAGMFKSVISFALVVSANRISKRLADTTLW